MLIHKHIVKSYLDCDEREATNYMNIIRTKVATSTKTVRSDHMFKGKNRDALVTLTCAKAEDVLAVSIKLLANTTNTRINKESWKKIQDVCIHSINKGLI